MATKVPTRKLTLMAPFEEVSGKFATTKETCFRENLSAETPPPTKRYFGARVLRRKTRAAGAYSVTSFYYRKNPVELSLSEDAINARNAFTVANQSAKVTLRNLSAITQINCDFTNKSAGSIVAVPVRAGVDSQFYNSLRGWVVAVRIAQINAGEQITASTDTWFT